MLFLVHTRERSALLSNGLALGADRIAAAFRSAATFGSAQWGAWVGTAPRVTRRQEIPDAFYTYAAWLYEIPDSDWATQHADYVQNALKANLDPSLHALSADFEPVTIDPYNEALHGTRAWWASGEASVTHTRDEFPGGILRTDANENPIGPTTPATHPTGPTEPGGTLSSLLVPLAILFTGGAIVYGVAVTAAQSFGARPTVVIAQAPPRRTRANPSRRRWR